MKHHVATIVNLIAELQTCQFVGFDYRAKKDGELARRVIIIGADYHELVKRSITELVLLVDENRETWNEVQKQASVELLASFNKTLEAHSRGEQNEDYTKRGQYIPIRNGLSINSTDWTVQLFGLEHSKVVLQEGVYPVVNSRPLTIAKKKLRKLLPVGRFKEFALDESQIHRVAISGNVLNLSEFDGISVL